MTTAILSDLRFAAHTISGHVERAERLDAIEQAISASGLRATLLPILPRPASASELRAVHSAELLAAIERIADHGGGSFDSDTYVTADSWAAATLAAGAAVRAVDAVLNRECRNAFALVRPPGHHATFKRAMGFCLLNHVAVAARYAVEHGQLERVAIVDFDVHHGNGTQDIFYDDPHVCFCSIHAAPFYPGTGTMGEIGSTTASGSTLNVPLAFGVGDVGYERIFREVIVPALRRWHPQLIIVSAGYDAHWSDPLGPMLVSVAGFAQMTRSLVGLADELCDGRLVLSLEGGYNLEALGAGVVASLRMLNGDGGALDMQGSVDAKEPNIDGVIHMLKRSHPLLVPRSET